MFIGHGIRVIHVVFTHLCRTTQLVESFGSETDFIVPVDGERIEAEGFEIVNVLQLTANALLHQGGEVYQQHFARVERQPQFVVACILGGGYFK